MILVNNLVVLFPYFLLLVVLTFVPGFLLALTINGKAGFIKNLALAPALTLSVISLATFVFRYLPIAWGMSGFFVFFSIFLGVSALLAKIMNRLRMTSNRDSIDDDLSLKWSQFGIVLLGWLVLIIPMLSYADFSRVIQGGDSNYHYNQVLWIERTGDIFPFTANAGLGGLNPEGWYYPTTWHAYIYLLVDAGASVIIANAVFLLLLPLIWLLGVSAFTVNVKRDVSLIPWAVVASLLVPLATIRLAHLTTLWPFILALTVLPGAMAYLLEVRPPKRKRHIDYFKSYGGRGIISAIVLVGLTGLHPSVIVAPSMGVFFVLIAISLSNLRTGIALRQWKYVVTSTGMLGLLLGSFIFFIYGPGPQQSQLHRIPDVSWADPLVKITSGTGVYVFSPYSLGFITWAMVLLLIPLGIFLHLKQRRIFILIALLPQWLIVMGVLFPLPAFSVLTSFYYNVVDRTKLAYAIFLIPVIAVAIQWMIRKVYYKETSILATVLVILFGGSLSPGVASDLDNALYPVRGSVRFLADDQEIELIRRLGDELKDSDFLLGDPAAGASLVYTLTGKQVVFKYPNASSGGAEDLYLQANFYNYRKDPRICRIIKKYGITHFYKDVSGPFNGNFTWRLRPGFYGVEITPDAFDLVDEGSTVKVYKIIFCDEDRNV